MPPTRRESLPTCAQTTTLLKRARTDTSITGRARRSVIDASRHSAPHSLFAPHYAEMPTRAAKLRRSSATERRSGVPGRYYPPGAATRYGRGNNSRVGQITAEEPHHRRGYCSHPPILLSAEWYTSDDSTFREPLHESEEIFFRRK